MDPFFFFRRVFKGDDRPSMMARDQMQRSSTLIDPQSLQRPISRSLGTSQAMGWRNSVNAQPLLNFDDDQFGNKATLAPNPRVRNGRSVFGTDTLWEREMVKLKEIEIHEQREKEETEKMEAEETARVEKKNKKGKKSKGKSADQVREKSRELEVLHEPELRISAEPPVLPVIQKPNPPPPVNDDNTQSESDDSANHAPVRNKARRANAETVADRWVAGSSDEDEEPRRTTGVGPRYRNQGRGKSQPADDDSEEDMPLAATVGRALKRVMSPADDDSDEDLPLSAMLDKAKISIPPINFDSPSVNNPRDDDDDDDEPLGLRASMVPPMHSYVGRDDDDDDKPLAFHPEQQRRTQYQVMAQQQQIMMQAQMQQSMFFGAPPMMGSGFFGPPMASIPSPMMMGLQQQMPSPPPAPDVGKFGLVDRWRRDVAVEGQP